MNISEITVALSEDAPSGEDLEYDLEYGELVRAAQGSPEQEIGDAVKEAIPPDWGQVRDLALALFSRTRDLRIAVLLTIAWLNTNGFAGLRDGLAVVQALSQDLWDSVHPQLDPDDGDSTIRCNAIAELNSHSPALDGILDAPFIQARRAGRFSLRDLKILGGELKSKEGDGRPVPRPELLAAAFQEVEPNEIEAMLALIGECMELAKGIEQTFVEHVGSVDAPALKALSDYLDEVHKFVAKQMSQLGIGDVVDSQGDGPVAGQNSGVQTVVGEIRSRQDVRRLLNDICAFYKQNEPSSPIPILLRRAAGLVDKNFLDILNDLAPGGVAEAVLFAGDVEDSWDSGEDWSTAPAAPSGEGVEKQEDPW